jgi:hypothetical protein
LLAHGATIHIQVRSFEQIGAHLRSDRLALTNQMDIICRWSLDRGRETTGIGFIGLFPGPPPPGNFDHPALDQLIGILVARDIQMEDSSLWFRWEFYKYSPSQTDFLNRMYNEPETLVNEIVDDVWGLFVEVRPTLESINR